jgi:nucleotide-binding universal stress UspA family protein
MPIVAYPLVSPITAEDRVRAVDEASQEAVELAGQAEVRAQPIGAVGDPATAILQVAETQRIDVIVVGSHERSWFDRLFHGSVAADVVRKANVPVLVVK